MQKQEKSYKSAKHPTALVLSPTTQVTAEKENNFLSAGRSTQETYKITIKMQLQGFQIFQYLQLLCGCFRKEATLTNLVNQ